MISTQNYEHLLFHVGCMTTAPYSKIAIITISGNSSINEFEFFKETGRYGNTLDETFRFAYSIDRDEESIKSVKEFTKTFDTKNLYYVDKVSENISSDVISKTFGTRNPSISIEKVIYEDKFYKIENNVLRMKEEFAKKLLISPEYILDSVKDISKLKEKDDFIFVTKDLSIKHEKVDHGITLRVGRSRSNGYCKYAVITIEKYQYYIKLDKNSDSLHYNDCIAIEFSDIRKKLFDEIKIMSDMVSVDTASRKKMYALKKTTESGNYESSNSSYSYIMAMSEDKDVLVRRYNNLMKSECNDRLLIKDGEYKTSYSGGTGGGHSFVSNKVEVLEFREFDMPELER